MQNRREFLKAGLAIAGATLLGPQTSRADGQTDFSDHPEGIPLASDIYNFQMKINVPQVYNNSTSMGYRSYKLQTIKGLLAIVWLDDGSFQVKFGKLTNSNFKVGGEKVTYAVSEMPDIIHSRYVYIGNNKTNKFTTPCLGFAAQFEPSYAIGEPDEDNSFTLMLSGKGTSAFKKNLNARIATRFSGYVAGMQGCGCADYGHKSPTRDADMCGPSESVNDVVPAYGAWRAIWKTRSSC